MDTGKFGAGHDFAHKRVKVSPRKSMEETKVSRTLSVKIKFFEWIDKNVMPDNDGCINVSDAVNELLQCGIAWKEKIKMESQTKLREFA